MQAKDSNVMKDIIIEKLVLNISTGQSGDRLTFATRISIAHVSIKRLRC